MQKAAKELKRGQQYRRERKWDLAEKCFLSALDCDKTLADAEFELGSMFFELGKTHLDELFAEAVSHLHQAAKLYDAYKPAGWEARINQIVASLETIELITRASNTNCPN